VDAFVDLVENARVVELPREQLPRPEHRVEVTASERLGV